MDPMTGNSRGYGFVRFTDEYEYLRFVFFFLLPWFPFKLDQMYSFIIVIIRALNDMQGVYIGSRQIRVSSASHQKANQASVIFFFFEI